MKKQNAEEHAAKIAERIVAGVLSGKYEMLDRGSYTEVVEGDQVRYIWRDDSSIAVRFGFGGVSYYDELGSAPAGVSLAA